MVAPMGRHKLFNPEGECATARGAAKRRCALCDGEQCQCDDRRQSPPSGAPRRNGSSSTIGRTAARSKRSSIASPPPASPRWCSPSMRRPAAGARAPRAQQHEPSPEIRNINMPGSPMARTFYHPDFAGKVLYPATWRELEWLVKRSPMPVMVKGVLRADDAMRCVECGARAVIVSNHGGRHLDTTVTTAAAIGEVARCARRQGRSLCRWRYPARHRYPQGAGARRPRRADRPADALGPGGARRRWRCRGDRASAGRTGAGHAAFRHCELGRGKARSVGAAVLSLRPRLTPVGGEYSDTEL